MAALLSLANCTCDSPTLCVIPFRLSKFKEFSTPFFVSSQEYTKYRPSIYGGVNSYRFFFVFLITNNI